MEHRDTPAIRRNRRNQTVVVLATLVLSAGVLASWLSGDDQDRLHPAVNASSGSVGVPPFPAPPPRLAPKPMRPSGVPAPAKGGNALKEPPKPRPAKVGRPGCPRCGMTLKGLGRIDGEWHIGAYRVLKIQGVGIGVIAFRRRGRTLLRYSGNGLKVGSSYGGTECNAKVLAQEKKSREEPPFCQIVWKARRWLKPGVDLTGNKIPNIVIAESTGGNDAHTEVKIFELGQAIRKVGRFVTAQPTASGRRAPVPLSKKDVFAGHSIRPQLQRGVGRCPRCSAELASTAVASVRPHGTAASRFGA